MEFVNEGVSMNTEWLVNFYVYSGTSVYVHLSITVAVSLRPPLRSPLAQSQMIFFHGSENRMLSQ